MSNQLLSSKVTIEEEEPSVRPVPALPTGIAAFQLITEKGPFESTYITSFEEYRKIFGGHIANSNAAAVVEAYFANGGAACWIARQVHYTDITDATSKASAQASVTLSTAAIAATAATVASSAGPYAMVPGQTLVVVIDSENAVTTTFAAASAARTAANAGTYAIIDGETLTVKIDGGVVQTVTFNAASFANIGAATAAEVAAVINAALAGASCDVNAGKPRITSDRKGTGSKVEVTGGTANDVLGFVTDEVAGTGNVSNILAVTATEVAAALAASLGATATATVVAGAVKITSATTGASSRVQVTGASTATAVGFDNALHTGDASGTLQTLRFKGKYDGTYAHNLRPRIEAPTSGRAGEFNVTFETLAGIRRKTYPNVVIGAANVLAANYVEKVINDENTGDDDLIAEDLLAATSAVNAVPALGLGAALAGGNDGLVGLVDADWIGSEASQTGLHAFDAAVSMRSLAVPDAATAAVHNAVVTYCSVFWGGKVFPVLDPPANQSYTQVNTYVTSTASLKGLSEAGLIYWPRWKIANPNRAAYGAAEKVSVPLSGHILGMYARVANAREGGIYDVPAGPDFGKLFGLLEPEDSAIPAGSKSGDSMREAVRDLLYPNRINLVWKGTGIPVNLDGARCLKEDGNWPTAAQRMGMSHIQVSLQTAMQIFRQKKRDEDLLAKEYNTIDEFLRTQCALGAFASKEPARGYWLDLGAALNPRSVPNRTKARIGVATAQPNEFIVLAFTEDRSLGA